MKKGTQTREKRSYRLLGGLTILSVLVSVMLGLFVSCDACLSGVLGGIVVVTLSAILSSACDCAIELRREENEARQIGEVSRKMPKRS